MPWHIRAFGWNVLQQSNRMPTPQDVVLAYVSNKFHQFKVSSKKMANYFFAWLACPMDPDQEMSNIMILNIQIWK